MAVYTGADVAQLDRVASSGPSANGGGCLRDAKVTFAARAGTTYAIAVDGTTGQRGGQGPVTLRISTSGEPAAKPASR